MKYQLTAKDADGTVVDRRTIDARDRDHAKDLAAQLRDRLAFLGVTKVTAKKEA